MGVEGILSAIDREVAREIEKLNRTGQARVQEILSEAERRVEQETERFVADRVDKEERLRIRKVHSAKVASSRAIADVRNGVFEELFRRAGDRLAQLRGSEQYREIFTALACDAADGLGADVVLHVDPSDRELADAVASKLENGATVAAEITTIGGLMVSSADARVVRDNTFEARLNQLRDGCAQQIWEVLEG